MIVFVLKYTWTLMNSQNNLRKFHKLSKELKFEEFSIAVNHHCFRPYTQCKHIFNTLVTRKNLLVINHY